MVRDVVNGRPVEIDGVVTGIPEVPVTVVMPPPSGQVDKVSAQSAVPASTKVSKAVNMQTIKVLAV